jgi:SAM-dependent methyltransferase
MPDSHVKSESGIWTPVDGVTHRDDEYDPEGFELLRRMQRHHFWYRGRHAFLLAALRRHLERDAAAPLRSAIDVGGGCGGWIDYLDRHAPGLFSELALADSSLRALTDAAPLVAGKAERYQVDLLRLRWEERWDVIFLLDVLEHVPDHLGAVRELYRALRPGGLLVVSVPALRQFWSYNDELAHHQRRYSAAELREVCESAGFQPRETRYFMFLLSPLYWISRRRRVDLHGDPQKLKELQRREHSIPAEPLNTLLASVFSLEAPLSRWVSFPWGTSLLGILRKPEPCKKRR